VEKCCKSCIVELLPITRRSKIQDGCLVVTLLFNRFDWLTIHYQGSTSQPGLLGVPYTLEYSRDSASLPLGQRKYTNIGIQTFNQISWTKI
jgi:hypothetical protein